MSKHRGPVRIDRMVRAARPRPASLGELTNRCRRRGDLRWLDRTAAEYLSAETTRKVGAQTEPAEKLIEFTQGWSDEIFPLNPWFIDGITGDEEDVMFGISQLRGGIPYALYGPPLDDEQAEWRTQDPVDAVIAVAVESLYPEVTDTTDITEATQLFARLLDGTPLEPAGLVASWLAGDTPEGNVFLEPVDWDEEIRYSDPWEREVVESARASWLEAERILEAMREFNSAWENATEKLAEELGRATGGHNDGT